DLLSGQVQVLFGNMPTSLEHIRAGRLRPLAVTGAKRSDALPDVPTIGEFVAGYEAVAINGIGAPRNTPTAVIDRLNKAITDALADSKLQARLAEIGTLPMPMMPAEFGRLMVSETDKWGKVVKFAGIKAE